MKIDCKITKYFLLIFIFMKFLKNKVIPKLFIYNILLPNKTTSFEKNIKVFKKFYLKAMKSNKFSSFLKLRRKSTNPKSSNI